MHCARSLIGTMRPNGVFYNDSSSSLPITDYSELRVIVPAFEHAQLLTRAMAEELGGCFIPPRINTLSAWLSMQMPLPDVPQPIAESERLMALYAQLREHAWLKKMFLAHKNTDLLPLAQTLITLSDELTQAMLPLVLGQGFEQATQVWHQALSSLPMKHALSDEAQLVWKIWTSQLDGIDAISLRFQQMLRLAETATDALLWINPVKPKGLDHLFLIAYAKKSPVQIISLDWRAAALPNLLSTAWREVIETCAEEFKGDKFKGDEFDTAALSLRNNLTHVSTIAADSLEKHAQFAAQTIVDWLQQGKKSIAIIAQDRVAARRIRALLERAQVHVADETGWKLSTTRAAAVIAAWFEVGATRADTLMLLDLLKSPYFQPASMLGYDEKSTWLMIIERALLRANVVGGWDAIIYALEQAPPECIALIEQLKRSMLGYTGRKNLLAWLKITQQAFDEFGILLHWKEDEAGLQVVQLLERLGEDCAQLSDTFSFSEWRRFVDFQLENTSFQIKKFDQRVVMLPLNGARLRHFDAVLMAGCDAAHLPSQTEEVLFFTNAVRRECGLATREERLRQQLRDFSELLSSNPEVVLSWQHQRHGEDNPVSPWIARLNLSLLRFGLNPLEMRQVQLVTQSLPAIKPQQPRPIAISLRPVTLSASGYNSFLACPYQFFATRMLGLSSLDTLSDMPEKRDYGGWLHAILKTYHDTLKAQPDRYPNDKQEALLRQISETMFGDILQKSPAALGYSVRWQKAIPAYIAWSQQHTQAGWQFEMGEVWLEKKLDWEGQSITLRGQIDRIDKNQAGEFAVLDYKTNPASILRNRLKDAEDHQLPFYGLLAEQETKIISFGHYVALEMTSEKLTEVVAKNYSTWQENLKASIIKNVTAIGQGAGLPAQGVTQVCQYCEVRGLCRKGAW
jgi:ATP-dependent helicase/nuclease subunit B